MRRLCLHLPGTRLMYNKTIIVSESEPASELNFAEFRYYIYISNYM